MGIGVHTKASLAGAGVAITSPSVTTTSGSTVLLFVAVGGDTFAGTPVQDSKGNTWTQVGTPLSASDGLESRCYKAVNITGGSGHTFTCTPEASGYPGLLMVEITGAPASPTVTADRQEDNSSPYTSPAISPSTATVLCGAVWDGGASGTVTDIWGGSFASGDKIEEVTDGDNFLTCSLAAAVKGSGGTFSSSVTVTGSITTTSDWIVAVETSGGGGGGAYNAVPVLEYHQSLRRGGVFH